MRFLVKPISAAVLALLLGASQAAQALDSAKVITQYVRRVWQLSDGLPSQVVYSVTQTRDGYLWLGTSAGLSRFDGVRFAVFDKGNTPALLSNMVWAVQATRDGGLWIGTSEGLNRLDRGRMTAFAGNSGLPDRFVQALLEDRRGRLWVGTPGGIVVMEGGTIRARFPRTGGATSISQLLEDRSGTIWITSNTGIAAIDGQALKVRGTGDGLADLGNVWIERDGGVCTLSQRQVFCLDQATWRARGERVENLPDRLSAVLPDRDGNLWMGATGTAGVLRLTAGKASAFAASEPLVGHSLVLAFYEDREGNLWICSSGAGLARVTDGRVAVFGKAEGLGEDRIAEVTADPSGGIWAGTRTGLERFANGEWTAYAHPTLPTGPIETVFADAEGTLWVTHRQNSLLYRIAGGSVQTYPANIVGGLFMMTPAREGGLWLAGSKGLFRFNDGRIDETPVTPLSVSVAREGRDGGLWIGSPSDGLLHRRGGTLTAYSTKNGLPSNAIGDLFEDAAGTLWIATDETGLVRFKDGRFTSYAAREGLADFVCSVFDDGQETLWLNTRKGIFRLDKRELEEMDTGRRVRLTPALYDGSSGLRSAQCHIGSRTVAAGRLWFASANGLVSVDLARARENAAPPPVHIEELIVDGRSVEVTPEMRLPAGITNLEIRYTAPSLAVPERVRFKFKMDGYDRDWTDSGARRVAYYTKPPHGSYAFRVLAANADGVWSPEPAAIAFTIAPHWYETWWAYVLSAVTLVALLAGGVRLRIGVVQRRADALEARSRELETIVGERTDELRGTVEQLRRAQEQLARVSQATPDKIENISVWGASMASEIATAVRAREIGIWRLSGDEVIAVTSAVTPAPSRQAIRDGAAGLIPVPGMTGEVRGVLVVEGAEGPWSPVEAQLLTGFAQQVGGALDLHYLRERLSLTEARQALLRRKMLDEGVEALKLCPACRRCFGDAVVLCPDDGAALDASRLFPLVIQKRYELRSLLGEGGSGHVFAAWDVRLRRDVAIKIIRAEHLTDVTLRFRIEREARTLAQIDHPGVAALFDSGELDSGSVFLVMELLRGLDLGQMIARDGPGSPAQVARLVREAAAALAAAHRRGVIHRDVKPANIFLAGAPGGFVTKVVDFGLATSGHVDVRVTLSGIMVGTPAYMSPEQVQGLALDPRSDLYSLAVVAYEALTGRRAVESQDVGGILIEVLYKSIPPVSSLIPALAPLDPAFALAFSKQPSERPDLEAWARDFAGALDRLPEGPHRWTPEADPSRTDP